MELVTTIIIIGVLLLISAFFSGSETALTAISKAKLHAMGKDGNPAAQRVDKLTDNMPKLLSTILLGNNLVNIGASALATGMLLKMFGESGILIATLVMTTLVLIFSEVLPKTIASLYPENTALKASLPMQALVLISGPITWLIDNISRVLMRLLGINPDALANFDEHDVRGAIGMGLQQDVLEKHEHRMLDSILDLDDISVGDVMVHRSNIEGLDIAMSPDEIFDAVQGFSHSRLPVWDDNPDNIIGVIHTRDLLIALRDHEKGKQKFNLKDIMHDPYFVPDIASIGQQLFEFKRHRRHLAIVVDEYGDLMGLVTLEDILEEIVGEIEDEHDVESSDFARNKDGSVTLSGNFPIRDANREFDWELPEDEDAVTLSGLIISELQRVPHNGEKITVGNVTFSVLAHKQHVITKLRAEPDPTYKVVET